MALRAPVAIGAGEQRLNVSASLPHHHIQSAQNLACQVIKLKMGWILLTKDAETLTLGPIISPYFTTQ